MYHSLLAPKITSIDAAIRKDVLLMLGKGERPKPARLNEDEVAKISFGYFFSFSVYRSVRLTGRSLNSTPERFNHSSWIMTGLDKSQVSIWFYS